MAEPEALKRFFVGESFTGCLVARLPKSPLGGVGNEIGRERAGVVIAVSRGVIIFGMSEVAAKRSMARMI